MDIMVYSFLLEATFIEDIEEQQCEGNKTT